ncbi:MAG: TolC family protein [Blastocatellia bacterium]|nr:TolC family protein [Blastocatellia bacterium]
MAWHKRKLLHFFALFVCFFVLSLQVSAQDGQTTTNDNRQVIPPPVKVDLPTDRTGVDPTKKLQLSLKDAISMALQQNLDVQIERDNVKIAEYNLLGSLGVYDIQVGSSFNINDTTFPVASALNRGGGGANTIADNTISYGFNGSRVFANGGQARFELNNSRVSTNNVFNLINPRFNSQAVLSYTQPLLRNFKINQNERSIRTFKKQLDLSDLTFRQRLISLIAQVQNAYYDLAFALKNAEIQREAVDLAAVQLRNNQIQVKAGTAAPIEIVSAEAEVERRKDAAISALLSITQAENSLKSLLLDDPSSDYWNYQIVPTDLVDFTPDPIDLQSAINIAMDRRPEIKQLELQGEINKIDLDFFRNQAKPQIDLSGSLTGTGLAGSQTAATVPGPNPGDPPIPVDINLKGNGFNSLRTLFDFRSYQVGLTINFPLRNRTAKANVQRTLVAGKQLESRKRQMLETVIVEVRNALQAVETARQRVEAARASVAAAEAQLKGEEQKFAVGLSTNFFVLQRQNDLSVSRGNELRARTDYNKARADLQRVMANNLP